MTPADIERAVTALRRAFPAAADEGVERFRRELAPLPVWSFVDAGAGGRWWVLADEMDVYAEMYPDISVGESGYDWKCYAWPADGRVVWYASTRSEAMREAERALGLPECEVVP